ncbi:GNAT family N-acetyltransferase [Pseudactinotalea terrae]|uniref:GNAT family N-acetyltransferase n=1 Tax=Pseudactinotalea terrae TaxID=1743262 RepID=UPI00139118DF|nr:GNAT family N-acetyltransferase [Pseudactinotalea terrae]
MDQFAEYEPRERRVGTAGDAAVAVRAATTADIDAIARVQEAAGRLAHRDAWRRAVTNPECCLLVAEAPTSTTVVGWAQTHHHTDPQDAAPAGHYLGGVTVEPAWRRGGVAVALTETRLRWVADRADEAFYVVNPTNRASIDLHRRWGFEEVLRAERLTGVEFTGGIGILMRAALR